MAVYISFESLFRDVGIFELKHFQCERNMHPNRKSRAFDLDSQKSSNISELRLARLRC